LGQESLSQLAESSSAAGVNEATNEQGMVDVAHAHSVFEEVDDLVEGHCFKIETNIIFTKSVFILASNPLLCCSFLNYY